MQAVYRLFQTFGNVGWKPKRTVELQQTSNVVAKVTMIEHRGSKGKGRKFPDAESLPPIVCDFRVDVGVSDEFGKWEAGVEGLVVCGLWRCKARRVASAATQTAPIFMPHASDV